MKIDKGVFRRAREAIRKKKGKGGTQSVVAESFEDSLAYDSVADARQDVSEIEKKPSKLRTMFRKGRTPKAKRESNLNSVPETVAASSKGDMDDMEDREQAENREPVPAEEDVAAAKEEVTGIIAKEAAADEMEEAPTEDEASVEEVKETAKEDESPEDEQPKADEDEPKADEEEGCLAVSPRRDDDDSEFESQAKNDTPHNPGFLCGCI